MNEILTAAAQSDAAPIRLLLVDDHPLVRDGLRARLGAVPGLEVVGEAGCADEALDEAQRLQPDMALVDIGMQGMNGIELTAQLRRRHPQIAVLILSMYANSQYVTEAIRAGARGYVLKDAPSREIIAAIGAIAAGGTFYSPALARAIVAPAAEGSCLTEREREVLILVARGRSNKQIARELDISVRTVETHRLSLRRKLDIDTPAALVKYALERGWIA